MPNGSSKRQNSGESSKYVADFETTTDPEDCRVWLWALMPIDSDEECEYGCDIRSFEQRLENDRTIVYFHNLAFDGSFVIDSLLRQGYRWTSTRIKPGMFSTLINRHGKFYSIKIGWRAGGRTELRDSLKKLPMSVAEVARSFNLPIAKGEIDYDAHRPIGYTPSDNEIDYIKKDVSIIAAAMRIQLAAGMGKLTVGSDALNDYKTLTGPLFTRMFPILSDTLDADIRRAYRGGFTYVDKRRKGVILGEGNVYDVNSLYPFVMRTCTLPYGEPLFSEELPDLSEDFPIYVATATITASLKPDHIPCIQIKGTNRFIDTEYVEDITEPTQLTFTNVDWKLWNEQYDVSVISFDGAWRFHGSKELFSSYVDKWSEVKRNSKGGARELAKLMLNSLYGKFATNPDITGKYPVLVKQANGQSIIKLKTAPEERRDPVYTPVGVFVTSYARAYTVREAQRHYDAFAYTDTDSLHLLGPTPEDIDIDSTRLGAWKHELSFKRALFVRPKCYSEQDQSGIHHTHIAGLPRSVADSLTIEDFTNGRTFSGKLSPKRVPGGVTLVDIGYTLRF